MEHDQASPEQLPELSALGMLASARNLAARSGQTVQDQQEGES